MDNPIRDSGDDFFEDDKNPRHRRTSWRDIVGEHSDERCLSSGASMRNSGLPRGKVHTSPVTRPSPNRLYSKEEVLAMIKESKLRRDDNVDEGWIPVHSKAAIKKASAEAREIMGVSKKKRKVLCWECRSTDHINVDCPLAFPVDTAMNRDIKLLTAQGTSPSVVETGTRKAKRCMAKRNSIEGALKCTEFLSPSLKP